MAPWKRIGRWNGQGSWRRGENGETGGDGGSGYGYVVGGEGAEGPVNVMRVDPYSHGSDETAR